MSEHVFREVADRLELVGDFDGLYRAEPDPWGQSAQGGDLALYYHESRERLIDALREHQPKVGLEVGCGHGHALRYLAWAFGDDWAGLDVSAEAVAEARRLHPDLVFMVGDICDMPEPLEPGAYDAVVLNQVLWYVLERLDAAVANCCRLLKPGGVLAVSQGFLREQCYGRELCDGFHGAVRLFTGRYVDRLRLLEARFDDSGRHRLAHGILVMRKL